MSVGGMTSDPVLTILCFSANRPRRSGKLQGAVLRPAQYWGMVRSAPLPFFPKHPQNFTGDQHPAGGGDVLQVQAEQLPQAAHPIVDGVAVEVQLLRRGLYATVLAEVAVERL